MSYKRIQSVRVKNGHKNLFKIEIADGDQSIYIRILTAKEVNSYSVLEVDIPTSSTNVQEIPISSEKTSHITIDKAYYLKLSYHWSGKVHLQKYHNNKSKRSSISQDIAAINISELKDNDVFHIASIVVNNLNFFPDNNNEPECEVLNLIDSNEDKFVLALYASKKLDNKRFRGNIIGAAVINDPEKEKDDPKNTIYYYLMFRAVTTEDVKNNDINISLGWNKNMEDISRETQMFFISSI